ncbi:hypothetical protein RFI_01577 [Reticulomyxa filosa]|uniref:Uncharacterized protein n=1 Tax=Reticulomyxa filosa TaxID=46433 RepID=X6PAD0_RETFI|nr:hypothetical protein RFI_01577 [Reticulomyxa filosa]|eukprot:ETO35485.1 hypothetical protein RFI_01577 [Reticulomyxa filosa]
MKGLVNYSDSEEEEERDAENEDKEAKKTKETSSNANSWKPQLTKKVTDPLTDSKTSSSSVQKRSEPNKRKRDEMESDSSSDRETDSDVDPKIPPRKKIRLSNVSKAQFTQNIIEKLDKSNVKGSSASEIDFLSMSKQEDSMVILPTFDKTKKALPNRVEEKDTTSTDETVETMELQKVAKEEKEYVQKQLKMLHQRATENKYKAKETTRQKNTRQQKLGQATFSLKWDRDTGAELAGV